MLLCLSVGTILLGLGYRVHGSDPSCPSNISPCSCDRGNGYFEERRIVCARIIGFEKLYPVLNAAKGYKVSFKMVATIFGDMPSDFFQGQTSKKIEFLRARVESFGSRPFTGLEEYLEHLYIQYCVLKDGYLPLGHLHKLYDFKFKHNVVGGDGGRLGNEWFRGGPRNLKTVSIMQNAFKEIGDQVFADLINVKEIRLTGNMFNEVSGSMFPRPANKLEKLDLANNMILRLAEDTFDGMPALKILSLSGNRLTTLPEVIFGRIWGQLHKIDFIRQFSEFKCDDTRMAWVIRRKSEMPSHVDGWCQGNLTLEEFLNKDPSDIEDIEEHS